MPLCMCKTSTGKRCSKSASAGSKFCGTHMKKCSSQVTQQAIPQTILAVQALQQQRKVQPLRIKLPKARKVQPLRLKLPVQQRKVQPLLLRLPVQQRKVQPLLLRLPVQQRKVQPLRLKLPVQQRKVQPLLLRLPVQQRKVQQRKVQPLRLKLQKPKSQPRGCVRQTVKKYTERPSPSFPANECCGQEMIGNDGHLWKSIANAKGICSWKVQK